MPDRDLETVLAYHERSKHRPGRYAASLGYLDWASQPNPFRSHAGATTVALPRRLPAPGPTYSELFTPDAIAAAPLDLALIDALLLHSLALSAWKQQGDARWSLRVNPSSGNLHPTEAYLLAPAISGLGDAPGLHHYSPLLHGLERRRELSPALWTALTAGLPQPCLLVGLSTIAWREAWKYGERAFRYCQHDLGHAIAAIDLAAAMLGWRALELPRPGDAQLATLLGLRDDSGPEAEQPETLLALVPAVDAAAVQDWTIPTEALAALARVPLHGAPNQLSEAHQLWPVIDEVTRATVRTEACVPDSRTHAPALSRAPEPASPPASSPASPPASSPASSPASPPASSPASALIRGRRSAVAMDGRTGLTRAGFYDMLLRTAHDAPPLRALAGPSRVDLAIFVHRVEGLDPGLYMLLRDPGRRERWQLASDPEFAWTRPEACPSELDLSLLRVGDGRQLAAAIACGQAIAGEGCFALAMLADMQAVEGAPWRYRRLFWETGAIGQILYLEAEALGLAATGIGCFFDDRMHALLGLQSGEFQSFYHFTVGGRVDDPRLRTLDPYEPLAP